MEMRNHSPFCRNPEVQDKGKPPDQAKLAPASKKPDGYQLLITHLPPRRKSDTEVKHPPTTPTTDTSERNAGCSLESPRELWQQTIKAESPETLEATLRTRVTSNYKMTSHLTSSTTDTLTPPTRQTWTPATGHPKHLWRVFIACLLLKLSFTRENVVFPANDFTKPKQTKYHFSGCANSSSRLKGLTTWKLC